MFSRFIHVVVCVFHFFLQPNNTPFYRCITFCLPFIHSYCLHFVTVMNDIAVWTFAHLWLLQIMAAMSISQSRFCILVIMNNADMNIHEQIIIWAYIFISSSFLWLAMTMVSIAPGKWLQSFILFQIKREKGTGQWLYMWLECVSRRGLLHCTLSADSPTNMSTKKFPAEISAKALREEAATVSSPEEW